MLPHADAPIVEASQKEGKVVCLSPVETAEVTERAEHLEKEYHRLIPERRASLREHEAGKGEKTGSQPMSQIDTEGQETTIPR